jgi:DNA-binding CsgD family transcriptional regulator
MLLVTSRRPAVTLTPRELEIVHLLRRGLTVKEVAGRLDISVWTVRHHLERARGRTDTETTVQLVALFARPREESRTA